MFLFQGLANEPKVVVEENTRDVNLLLFLSSLSITSIVVSPFHPSLLCSSALPELSHGSSVYIPQFPRAGGLPGVQRC